MGVRLINGKSRNCDLADDCLLLCTLFVSFLLCTDIAVAQNGMPAVDLERSIDEIKREQRRQNERSQGLDPLPDRLPFTPEQQIDIEVAEGGPCFDIQRTQFEDDTGKLPLPPGYDALNERCADKRVLSDLINKLNRYYQDAGYITTRVYLKPQNIRNGELLLVARAGQLEGVKYSDERIADRRLKAAYPLEQGEVINLRALEQGLDNFNRPASQSGKAELYPGSEPGQSILVMDEQLGKPWQIDLRLNNHGYSNTGLNKGVITYSQDNLFELNETFSISLNRNLDDTGDTKLSQSIAFDYSQPYKNWLFLFSKSNYDYKRILAGINQDYVIDGFSKSLKFKAEHLLYRGQQARVYATGGLANKESENYIEGLRITSQSRDLSLIDLGLRGDYGFQNGAHLEWSLSAIKKIDAFGSQKSIPGITDDDFSYLSASAKLEYPSKEHDFTYLGELVFQHSDDELTGSEQFSAGGMSSVRGFHQDAIYGNTGFYWRNQINPKPYQSGDWRITTGIAFDIGVVKSPASIDWSGNQVAGAALLYGMKYRERFRLDLMLAQALKRPDDLVGDKHQAHLQISYRY